LKFQAVAEKTAKHARGLLYFAAPGRSCWNISVKMFYIWMHLCLKTYCCLQMLFS